MKMFQLIKDRNNFNNPPPDPRPGTGIYFAIQWGRGILRCDANQSIASSTGAIHHPIEVKISAVELAMFCKYAAPIAGHV